MFNRACVLVILLAASAAVACDGPGKSPSSPSVAALNSASADTSATARVFATSSGGSTVNMFDACDPETFNAALGAGTCVRSGGVTFDKFIEQLQRLQMVGAWRFAPTQTTMAVGSLLVAHNRGGETHTFTEVEEFGGGIVPALNNLAGVPNVAPECTSLTAGDFIAPGASSSETEDEEGVEKYQCCIHPWMHAEVRVGGR